MGDVPGYSAVGASVPAEDVSLETEGWRDRQRERENRNMNRGLVQLDVSVIRSVMLLRTPTKPQCPEQWLRTLMCLPLPPSR